LLGRLLGKKRKEEVGCAIREQKKRDREGGWRWFYRL
jgi:hypothetical protein